MNLKLFLLLVVVSVSKVEGARILFVTFAPSLSHHLFYRPIIRELCARGHEVVSVSPDPMHQNITNLKEIDIHNETYSAFNIGDYLMYSQQAKPRLTTMFKRMGSMVEKLFENMLTKPEFRALHNEKFDVIILEWFYGTILSGLKDQFKCPLIGISSADIMVIGADALGNPSFPSYYVDFSKPSGRNLGFYQRLENFAYGLDMGWMFYSESMEVGVDVYKKVYNQDIDMEKIASNLDLVLVNYNPIFHVPKPLIPAIIPIGGLHERQRNPLPQDLKQYLDSAKGGVIYFSLGSNVKSKSLPKDKFDAIIGAFNQLPYQILWKWENKNLPNKPKNVHIQQWLPQQDVLDHPNIKGFVTQGGIQSIEEAIRAKVPMVVMPFGGDQEYNAYRIEELQIGKYLTVDDLTANTLATNLREIIEDPLYQKKINKVSDLLWDQPMKPLDKAMWWIEYVIRHKGAEHLRSPAADMSWFKLLSLDVISFLLGCFVVILILVVFLVKFIVSHYKALLKRNKIKRE